MYIIFGVLPPALTLCPFKLSSLCSGNPIPVNHQVINDHIFPAEYGWLHLTLQHDLARTDRRTGRQQNNKLPLSWTGSVISQLSPLNIRGICHTGVYGNREFCCTLHRSEDQCQDSWTCTSCLESINILPHPVYLKYIAVVQYETIGNNN